jgi:uncharacterized membrane protein
MATPSPRHRFSDYSNLPFEVFIAIFTVLPIVVLIYFYPALPEKIPEYLNLRGEVEVWGRKGFASVFRLPLMAIDLQLICLLMKYGLWQAKIAHPLESSEQFAIDREKSIKLQMSLWDWFRALIAFKLGASSLEVIFLSIQRFHFLSTPMRLISWAAGILGVVGGLFYGYRLVIVNRRLKEAGAKHKSAQLTDRSYLHGGFLYFNPADPSLFNDKYLINFANKWAYVFLGCLVCLPVLMFLPMLNF